MISVTRHTWKTDLTITVRARPSTALQRDLQDLLSGQVASLDRLASRFRRDSELTRVNDRAGRWVEVSWDFVTVLTACLDAARATGGLVDPTLGGCLTAAGYDRWAHQPTSTVAQIRPGRWRGVGIRPGREQAQVIVPSGHALDLGSVAKAWLADRLATTVARSGYDVCANMGGDIRVISRQPWTLWADPEVPGVAVSGIEVTDAGLATSGTGHRRWDGGHHLIDPRTGHPAHTPWHSVSVVAGTACDANAAATAGMVLGDKGPAWMSSKGLDARFASPGAVVATGRWPQEVAA